MSADVRTAIEGLEKFDLLHEIHEGANAHAFCANHRHLQEKRFLKAIYLPEEDSDSILREPRTLIAALEAHPVSRNIVRLFDAETIKVGQDNYVLLQMEYIEGSSLQSLVETRMFGQQEAVRLTIELLQGVAHLHRQRFVHRDLKPGNILLFANVPKIADFGSVSLVSTDTEFVTASKHSDLYVPPEGWGPAGKYTFASDVYQVALVFYQLVNGPLPTDGAAYLTPATLKRLRDNGEDYRTISQYAKSVAHRESFAELTSKEKLLESVSIPRPYCSPAIRRIIQRATKADLRKRYQSAEECLNKLSQISTPDWKPTDGYFEAIGWHTYDWRVYERAGVEVVVEKKRSKQYRRCHRASDLVSAFKYVEDI